MNAVRWRAWKGGDRPPTHDDAMLFLRFRNGWETKATQRAGGFRWTDTGDAFDIVAWRLP